MCACVRITRATRSLEARQVVQRESVAGNEGQALLEKRGEDCRAHAYAGRPAEGANQTERRRARGHVSNRHGSLECNVRRLEQ